jgi:isopentenyl-diphosphate delta-isomerase
MGKVTATPSRKDEHIRVNLEEDVRSGLTSGLEHWRFEHNPVPEIDLRQVDLRTSFLGRRLRSPILISSMTGGTEKAGIINQRLAEAAQTAGASIGLGSQRAALEDPSLAATFQVRRFAPDVLLFANLGAIQLNYGYGLDECKRAVEMIEADALILHLNALQEALQLGGNVDFSGLLTKIGAVCRGLAVPVIAKEVGWGIPAAAAAKLVEAGVAAIDVAGAGGTSWSQVEMHRAETEDQARLAAAFADWGTPTADALTQVHRVLPAVPLIASGGVRTGIDMAKCLALGADLAGMAGPFLKAAAVSTEQVVAVIEHVATEIRLCMFATGSPDLHALRADKLRRVA